MKCIGKIESIVLKKGKETKETRYYISSKTLTAQELNDVARKHWRIENRLHWFLDCVFNEDCACIRNENSAENVSVIRKWAYAMLVKAKKKNLSINKICYAQELFFNTSSRRFFSENFSCVGPAILTQCA